MKPRTDAVRPPLDEALAHALELSFLKAFPPHAIEAITSGAAPRELPAGTMLDDRPMAPRMYLIVSGLLRVFLTAPSGREVTVRYARQGDVLGTVTVFGEPTAASFQAITPSIVLKLDVQRLRSLAAADARIACAVGAEVTRRLNYALDHLAGNTFGSMRQRIARHLLDIAVLQGPSEVLMAPVSQREIADAVGSIREVVARILGQLRQEGVIRPTRAGVVLTDVAALGEIAWPRSHS